MAKETIKETIYVSWGGTGRGAAVRAAVRRAGEAGQNLRYLAILDDDQFGDLTPKLAEMVAAELTWLLKAQLRMIDLLTEPAVQATVEICNGDIEYNVTQVAARIDADLILLGAPLGKRLAGSVRKDSTELLEALRQATGADVEIIGSDN
ncbi:universal stress protein [Desulfogranum japonicum]|uniref:universal stress protein n=1 Tax=Desulfogranum japonicum TaxID=231447 RepID=UPI00040238C1|nr:universal stress protein [Desulfogranum japonicum]